MLISWSATVSYGTAFLSWLTTRYLLRLWCSLRSGELNSKHFRKCHVPESVRTVKTRTGSPLLAPCPALGGSCVCQGECISSVEQVFSDIPQRSVRGSWNDKRVQWQTCCGACVRRNWPDCSSSWWFAWNTEFTKIWVCLCSHFSVTICLCSQVLMALRVHIALSSHQTAPFFLVDVS